MKRIIFMLAGGVLLALSLCVPLQACVVEVEVIVGNIVERPAICGVEDPPCGDWAKVTMDGPNFHKVKEEEDGCPSDVKLVGPKASDANNLYPGNCWIPAWAHAYGDADGCEEAKRGYGLASTPGWTVTAKAEAHVGTVAEGEVTRCKVTFRPCPAVVVVVFTWPAGGKVTVGHKIKATTHVEGELYAEGEILAQEEILLESYTEITDTSPDIVTDSTGLLTWQRFPYEGNPNAFRLVDPCEPIVLKEYSWYLDPNEKVEIITSITTEVNISDVTGDGFVACITPGEELCLLDSIPGDLNNDCKVNWDDFCIMADNWLETGTTWPSGPKPLWFKCWENPRQCHGEVNGEMQFGIYWVYTDDLAILAAAYGTVNGDPAYNPCADLDHDEDVDEDDEAIMYSWFGMTEVPDDCPITP